MQTVLFHSNIFGPIKSRRLGTSLGINLMPNDGKVCSFDCLYCEAGYNAQGTGKSGIPKRETIKKQLRDKLAAMSEAGESLDVITFSGNGEPTLHPQFKEVVHDVINLRNRFFPQAKVTVLSNATMLGKTSVREALNMVDNNVLKLDSAVAHTMRLINRPVSVNVIPEGVISSIKAFEGKCIVQTMLVRGEHDGETVDNTTDAEVDALINAYIAMAPREIMIYSIDRKTPEEKLVKVPADDLKRIAARIEKETGIPVQVTV